MLVTWLRWGAITSFSSFKFHHFEILGIFLGRCVPQARSSVLQGALFPQGFFEIMLFLLYLWRHLFHLPFIPTMASFLIPCLFVSAHARWELNGANNWPAFCRSVSIRLAVPSGRVGVVWSAGYMFACYGHETWSDFMVNRNGNVNASEPGLWITKLL